MDNVGGVISEAEKVAFQLMHKEVEDFPKELAPQIAKIFAREISYKTPINERDFEKVESWYNQFQVKLGTPFTDPCEEFFLKNLSALDKRQHERWPIDPSFQQHVKKLKEDNVDVENLVNSKGRKALGIVPARSLKVRLKRVV